MTAPDPENLTSEPTSQTVTQWLAVPDIEVERPGVTPEVTVALEWLPADQLVISPDYQRDVSHRGRKVVRRIAEDFHWARFGVLSVCSVNEDGAGPYAILDGQHRAAAAKVLGISQLPCLVLPHTDLSRQAAHFIAINQTRTAVSGPALFKARVLAGDPIAIEMRDLCAEHGVRLSMSKLSTTGQRSPATMAYSAIEPEMRDPVRRARLSRVLSILGAQTGEFFIRIQLIKTLISFFSDRLSSGWSDDGVVSLLNDPEAHCRLRGAVARHRAETGDTLHDARALVFWRELELAKAQGRIEADAA